MFRTILNMLSRLFFIFATLSLVACGGGGSSSAGTPLLGVGNSGSGTSLSSTAAYQIALTPTSLNVATNSVFQFKAVVTVGGSPAPNAQVTFALGSASSGPTLNGQQGSQTVTTGSDGTAYVVYQAGPKAGMDVVIASVGTPGANLSSQSATIAVTTSAPSGWTLNLAGIPTQGTCATTTNLNGSSLFCGPVSVNTVDATSGLQYVDNGAHLGAKVVDASGNPVIGASVSFTMGSTTTSATLGYCKTSSSSAPCTPSTALVQAGVLDNKNNVTTTVTATTGTDGVAYVNYASGGQSGYDVVNVTVSYPNSSGTGLVQATQSVTMQVQ